LIVHEPPDRDPSQPAPLLIALHARSSSGRAMELLTGLDAAADAAGMVVVYPDSAGYNWGEDTTRDDNPDDVGFIAALIGDGRRLQRRAGGCSDHLGVRNRRGWRWSDR
jgi:poly(3-hydroxybutyrate) depolymerase